MKKNYDLSHEFWKACQVYLSARYIACWMKCPPGQRLLPERRSDNIFIGSLMKSDAIPQFGGKRLKSKDAVDSKHYPLVTVVTAVYNGAAHLAGCLESVLAQDYPNIEHIVIDGGSSDGTVDVLRQYDDRIALWKSEPDRGVYDAWNKALLEARGEWICFLGADDEFLPNSVSAYMTLAASSPLAEFLSSRVKLIHASGYERTIGRPWTWTKFSRAMCTPHVGSMHGRSLFARLGTYDTSYRIVADYEFLLRARRSLRTAYMPVVTVRMRVGGVSCSRIALDEQARAKAATGGRSQLRTAIELYLEKAKFLVRPLHYALGGLFASRPRQRTLAHRGSE